MNTVTAILPEIVVATAGLVILMAEVFASRRYPFAGYWIAQATLVAAFGITILTTQHDDVTLFYTGFVRDGFSDLLKIFLYVSTFLSLNYSRHYLLDRAMMRGEFYALVLFSLFGMQVLVSAGNLLNVYVGIEIMSLSIYALVAWRRDHALATEAAMKYFVLGSLASGMLLYGMSMIYGATGSIQLTEIARLGSTAAQSIIFQFGLVFLIVGVGFKLGAVPFHMWMPDVYHGAPTPMTLFLATASKLATFALLIRLWVEALEPVLLQLQPIILSLSVLSLLIGNIIAIAQRNFKRLLAYSAISHVGFVLIGVASGGSIGVGSALYYMVIYCLAAAAGLGVLCLITGADSECDDLSDLRGLSRRAPVAALLLMVVLFSMTGVPPTAGFYAKFTVLQAAVQADLIWLAVLGMIMSVVAAFYYLRIIKVMYFDSPDPSSPALKSITLKRQPLVCLNAAALILLGLFPSQLILLCRSIFGL